MGYSKDTFAHRLVVARAENRMTQDDLAEAAGVSVDAIRVYETAKNTPRLDKAYDLAYALGVTIDSLVELPSPSERG